MRGFTLEVAGPYACFTRPEMKVERVSYDVITPSAARGIFEAILWKPAIRWRITRIDVLAPVRWISVRRNEVQSVASPRVERLLIEDVRAQRAALILRDVCYRLHATFDFYPPETVQENGDSGSRPPGGEDSEAGGVETEAKYASMFERRARRGQCFHQPYLGTREFACSFRLVEPAESFQPINDSQDLGWMLYDIDFSESEPRPMFYRAAMNQGVIEVPHPDSMEVVR